MFFHTKLLGELCLESGNWYNYLQMDQETYHKLLSIVEPLITKQDTCMRKSVTAYERLTAILQLGGQTAGRSIHAQTGCHLVTTDASFSTSTSVHPINGPSCLQFKRPPYSLKLACRYGFNLVLSVGLSVKTVRVWGA